MTTPSQAHSVTSPIRTLSFVAFVFALGFVLAWLVIAPSSSIEEVQARIEAARGRAAPPLQELPKLHPVEERAWTMARDPFAAEAKAPEQITFRYVLYFTSESPDQEHVAGTAPVAEGRVRLVDSPSAVANAAEVSVAVIADAAADYPLPDKESLRFFARGLNEEEQARALQRKLALQLDFVHPRVQAYPSLRSADEVAHLLARSHDALIWDEELRLLYSADAWEAARLSAPADSPHVLSHTVVHSYSNGDHLRSVSLGMYKLGLPDLVVERTARSNNTQLASLLNGLAQHLVEGGAVGADGEVAVDVATIKSVPVRDLLARNTFDNATGKFRVRMEPVSPEVGDADNALLALRFDNYEGSDEFARQGRATSELFGWSDSIKMIEHDDALTAASAAARALLPDIRDRFQQGLGLNEQLLVKAPFETPEGGSEWMWVEVTSWNDADLGGLLANEPFDIPDLHNGEAVSVRMDDVFDYQWVKADGSIEGNTTGEVIEAMQGRSESRGASPTE